MIFRITLKIILKTNKLGASKFENFYIFIWQTSRKTLIAIKIRKKLAFAADCLLKLKLRIGYCTVQENMEGKCSWGSQTFNEINLKLIKNKNNCTKLFTILDGAVVASLTESIRNGTHCSAKLLLILR